MAPDQGKSKSDLATRHKLILVGLYLSRFDSAALSTLGFSSFSEAFNVIGYALGSAPASIKNYRDEFDPLFPNERKGWHKRALREYCRAVYEQYRTLDFDSFTRLIKSFFESGDDLDVEIYPIRKAASELSVGFAQRLATGQAAERYFRSVYSGFSEFGGRSLEDTTQLGCGYDFRLRAIEVDDFLAVEVKGIMQSTGSISMTEKEFSLAESLRERFFLFVVRNFRESPNHSLYRDPVSCGLNFNRIERRIIQVSWSANV